MPTLLCKCPETPGEKRASWVILAGLVVALAGGVALPLWAKAGNIPFTLGAFVVLMGGFVLAFVGYWLVDRAAPHDRNAHFWDEIHESNVRWEEEVARPAREAKAEADRRALARAIADEFEQRGLKAPATKA